MKVPGGSLRYGDDCTSRLSGKYLSARLGLRLADVHRNTENHDLLEAVLELVVATRFSTVTFVFMSIADQGLEQPLERWHLA